MSRLPLRGSVERHVSLLRHSLDAARSNWRKERIPYLSSLHRTVRRWENGPENAYFVTSEKGLYRCDSEGVHLILNVPLYGCAIVDGKVLMGLYVEREDFFAEGDANALHAPGPFDFRVLYRARCNDSNERMHQITACGSVAWAAHTKRGAGLRYDTRTGKLTRYTLLRDAFGAPVTRDNNHINSIVQYGDVVLFTAYSAGDQSLIGVFDGERVTGFGYPNRGVHDIYLTRDGFLFFDTFGANEPGKSGVPVTESGPLLPEFFDRPPGFVLRGAAQQGGELVIGSSHKGERRTRFNGSGQLLISQDSGFRTVELPFAQVYQMITLQGGLLAEPAVTPLAKDVIAMLCKSLGEPIYEGKADIGDL